MSSIALKTLMALSGLFLCLFLTVHLLGNVQLFLPESQAQTQFNWYADFLSQLTVIKIAAKLTFLSLILHTVFAVMITLRNRQTSGVAYKDRSQFRLASWYSQTMGVLGTIVLVFLVIHLSDFWWPYTSGAEIGVDAAGRRDLYGLVAGEFQKRWKVIFYVVGVLAVGFHLLQGVYSSLRSLGIHHPGYARLAKWLGVGFAIVVTIGFGLMPVYMFFQH